LHVSAPRDADQLDRPAERMGHPGEAPVQDGLW
jgi:hypothetical protein